MINIRYSHGIRTMLKRVVTTFSILIIMFAEMASATISVRVYSIDEAYEEPPLSKPRIYIENNGTESISDFYYYYFFTVEDGKVPEINPYYNPDASVTLNHIDGLNYLVKYDFTGKTLQPGQVLPNTSGNCLGIHYPDWSYIDKSNDFSNNCTKTFQINENIPVFLQNGTQIYGNVKENAEIPGQVVQEYSSSNSIGEYTIFSKDSTDIRDRAQVTGGLVGSSQHTEIGCNSEINGSVHSGGNIFLRERANIIGDVIATGEIIKQNNIVITGDTIEHAIFDFPSVEFSAFDIGTDTIIVWNDQSYNLTPGAYDYFHAYSISTIIIYPGVYTFRKFIIEPDVNISLEISENERIQISVQDEIRFGDRTMMSFANGTELPLSVTFNSNQTTLLTTGVGSNIYGFIKAPESEIHVYTGTNLHGILYGRKVVVEPEAVVCKPPVLYGLWHSGWAFAPSFDPAIFQYTAIVPDATATIKITPSVIAGQIVSINGNSPGTPISLPVSEKNISILLNSPEACGTTEYSFNVKKTPNYMIYVNDDSPCNPGMEDGNSWSTAFKNLQQAIDTALVKGKEIWVAEGIYKPTYRTDSSDPRTATFFMKPGIAIKGGFSGSETDSTPSGSIYNTVLTGDLAANDDSITVWPPAISDSVYICDNSYHVITIKGFKSSISLKLSGLTITGGVANGDGDNRVGAGILNKDISPTFNLCNITRNYAASSGAGIYDEGGTKSIINCLFNQNASVSGNGGGLYINNNGLLRMEASVFDSNMVIDTLDGTGGGALFTSEISTQIINSIFTRNKAGNKGGAVYNSESNVTVMNCTFANNTGLKGIGGINNERSTANIINTILYDFNGELSDSGFTVTHSCVKGGHAGDGNISTDPNFLDINNPAGSDRRYGDKDDGLQLNTSSLCIDTGTVMDAPSTDILKVLRPAGDGIDIGAYEYIDLDKRNKLFFGKMIDGVFYENDNLDIIINMIHPVEIMHYSKSNYHRIMRAYVEKNDYTKNNTSMKVYIAPADSAGNSVANEIEIKLYKIGEENGLLIFQSMKPDYTGKVLIFTEDPGWYGYINPWAYVVYMSDVAAINYRVPHSQFK